MIRKFILVWSIAIGLWLLLFGTSPAQNGPTGASEVGQTLLHTGAPAADDEEPPPKPPRDGDFEGRKPKPPRDGDFEGPKPKPPRDGDFKPKPKPPLDEDFEGPKPKLPREGGPVRGFRLIPPFAAEEMDLTAEQLKQIAALEKEMKAKLYKILTPEQQKILEDARPPRFLPGGPGAPGGRPGQGPYRRGPGGAGGFGGRGGEGGGPGGDGGPGVDPPPRPRRPPLE